MPFSEIDILPAAPQRDDPPEDFADTADVFVVALKTFSEQLNVFIAELETAASLIAAAPEYSDPGLVALTGNTPAADRVPYYTGSGTSDLATLTAAGRALLDDADAAAQRTTLGLGTAATQNTGAFDAAGAASGAVSAHVGAGDPHTQYLLESAVSAFMLTVLNDADAATARGTLGAGEAPSVTFGSNTISLTMPTATGDTLLIQGGSGTLGANTTGTINFPTGYSTAPVCIVSGGESGTGGEGDIHKYQASTTTGQAIVNSAGNSGHYSWLAVGKA